MKKVVYIIGLGHSGSTLLDLLLSHHEEVVGLGEVYSVIVGKESNLEGTLKTCSCGEKLRNCSLWGNNKMKQVRNRVQGSYKEVYERIINQTDKKVIIDSSKKKKYIKRIKDMDVSGKVNLKTIFLVRDVRGWVHSMRRTEKKKNLSPRPTPYIMNKWWIRNRRTIEFLRSKDIEYETVSYENICLDTETTIKEICNYLGIDFKMWGLKKNPCSHIASGNRMKDEIREGELKIRYDKEWFKSFSTNIWYSIMPHLHLWQNRNIYQ